LPIAYCSTSARSLLYLPQDLGFAGFNNRRMTIKITVKLFAAYQEAYQASELRLELPQSTSVIHVFDRLLKEKPELEKWRNLTRFGVNLQFVTADTLLENEDELVLIPPVSGG
jgi:sulfur-carrier protein